MIRSKKGIVVVAAALLVTALALPAVQAAPDTPYYGKEYSQPEKVLKLYPDPDVRFETPAFTSGQERFTSQEEMIQFLRKLDESSPWTVMKSLGRSQEGREIPVLFFQRGSGKGKPTVWLQGQIHGNEPAAGEAVLVMAQKLAGDYGKKLLKRINVVLVPRVNPDGSYAFERRMANGMDGNRDHLKFDTPEARAIHSLFNEVKPEVVIDAHEYNPDPELLKDVGKEGALKYHDLLILSGKNLNIPEEIRDFADGVMVKAAKTRLAKRGFSSGDYYTAAKRDGQLEITEGGPEPRIGRNSFALKPALSFLVETRGIGIGRENFLRRVAAQVTTHQSLLETAASRADQIRRLVDGARKEIAEKGKRVGDDDEVIVTSRAQEYSTTLPVVDIAEAKVKEIPVRYFSHTEGKAELTRERPLAYLLMPEQTDAAWRLKFAGVKVKRMKKAAKLPVESYIITGKETQERPYEGHPQHQVTTKVVKKTVVLPKGSWIIPMDQPTANLAALAMEPESTDSYVTFGFIPSKVGEELPIYRYMGGGRLGR
jgi:hypothetical protein